MPGISPNVTGDGAPPNGLAESGPLPSAETLIHSAAGREADTHAGSTKQSTNAIAIKLVARAVFISRLS